MLLHKAFYAPPDPHVRTHSRQLPGHTYIDQLQITLSTLVGHTGQMRVPLLTVLANNTTVIVGILTQEPLWVVVAVNVYLGQCIVSGRLLTALVNSRFQPGQKQLQPRRK